MGRGPKKHLKRLNAPKRWMLEKLTGAYAPKPSAGPHKLRECMPLVVLLRNRLKYALTYRESMMILKQRQVFVDGKVKTDVNYPIGFQDVVVIPKTKEMFRVLFDVKGRFALQPLKPEEAQLKLAKVVQVTIGPGGAPHIVTHDGRTFRYVDPAIKVNDTVKIAIDIPIEGSTKQATAKVDGFVKFEIGAQIMATAGRNIGRVGVIISREHHDGDFDIVHVKDSLGHTFTTRLSNVFVIGKGGSSKSLVSLPKGKGVKLSIADERDRRLTEKAKATA